MTGPVIRIGDLRDVVAFQRRDQATDDLGNLQGTWTNVVTGVAAKIAPTRGGEEVRAARLTGIANYDVTVRVTDSTALIQTGDRLRNERSGETYAIKWLGNLDERGRYLTLMVQKGGAE